MHSYRGVTKEMTAKLRSGDSISDEELITMLRLLRVLEQCLAVMPDDYGLALRDVRMQIHRLEGYKDSRGLTSWRTGS